MMNSNLSRKNLTSNLLVGALVTSALMSLFIGPQNAGTLLLLSVICTFGLSLIIWLPIFWIVGYVTLTIADLINQRRNRGSSHTGLESIPSSQSIDSNAIALSSYIQRSRLQGASDTQIITRLQDKGWTEAEIQHAFQSLSTH
jgi:hypothetical protein